MSANRFLSKGGVMNPGNPYRGSVSIDDFGGFAEFAMNRNAHGAMLRRRGAMGMGDPSWLSQIIKNPVKSLGAIVTGDIPALAGIMMPKEFGGGNQAQTRAGASAGMGKAAGMTSALAPMTPMSQALSLSSSFGPGQGNAVLRQQGGSGMGSSGGVGMAIKHFFGTSHSQAIPVDETKGIRPKGYHVNRHGYYLSSISTWVPEGSVYVPNRRRNPLNPRALHRSIARLISAKHAVKKLHILDVPRRPRRQKFLGRIPASRRLKAG